MLQNGIIEQKNTPDYSGILITLDKLLLTVCKCVELDNKPVLWEGNATTNIERVLHTAVKFITVVWADNQVVAVFLEFITNAWVEDSNILFGCIFAPERILRDESTSSRSRVASGIG